MNDVGQTAAGKEISDRGSDETIEDRGGSVIVGQFSS